MQRVSTNAVTLERLLVTDFKSFCGTIEVPFVLSRSRKVDCTLDCDDQEEDREEDAEEAPGSLTCVIGPNGSGKSTIADALLFCFGEKDARSRHLSSLIHENSGTGGASVSVEFRVTQAGHQAGALGSEANVDELVRVTRSIISRDGKSWSEYSLSVTQTAELPRTASYAAAAESPPADSAQKTATKSISRTDLTKFIKTRLGIDLDVVDTFICKQQGASVVQLKGPELLALLEKLVGTAHLAEAILRAQQDFESRTKEGLSYEDSLAEVKLQGVSVA